MKFKVGDKVRCIVGGDGYQKKVTEKGKIYTVDVKFNGNEPNERFLGLKEFGGVLYLACNFELVEQTALGRKNTTEILPIGIQTAREL